MHRFVVLLPLLLLLTATCAQAQPAAKPACDKKVRFSADWFPDPEVDNSKSAAEVSSIGSAVRGSGTQIGHVVVQTQLTVVPQTTCDGVTVRLAYLKPVLRVAREMAPGTCAYARVMTHELMHVRIHRDIARQFRELDYPWTRGATSAAILAYAKEELDRLMQAQDRFDSPEEYARNATVCGGEITRLVKTEAPGKPAPNAAPAAAPKVAQKAG